MTPEKIARVLAKKFPQIKAISLYGSHALGYNDRHTDDFDLAAFAEPIPPKSERKKVLIPVIKKWKGAYRDFPFIDLFDAGRYKDCSVWWTEVGDAKKWLGNFKKKSEASPEMVNFIYSAKILYDPQGLLKQMQDAMKHYPEELRRREIGKLTAVFRLTRSNMIEKEESRGNWNFLNSKLAETIQVIQSAAYALNREYWSSPKWAFRDYEKFRILPKDFLKGLETLNNPEGASFQEKAEILDHLADELRKMAKKEVPGARVRTRF